MCGNTSATAPSGANGAEPLRLRLTWVSQDVKLANALASSS